MNNIPKNPYRLLKDTNFISFALALAVKNRQSFVRMITFIIITDVFLI